MKQRILVTGGSRGIGRAISTRLARDGFHVVVGYRVRADAAKDVQAEIEAAGGEAGLLALDVADREQCREALAAEVERAGAFYGVVCNAGIHKDAPFPGLSGDDWDSVLRTNLDGFYNVLHPLVMPMIRQRVGGRIVVLSSLSGVVGNRGQVNYSASKAGLIGAARSLSLELAKRKITVNSVAPGLIDTEMLECSAAQEMLNLVPMRRLGTSEDVAGAVSYLCSDDASYMTGQVLSVNGGIA
jgi:3-oxoacyl-[acyl-carrier protein] reductase